MAALSKSVLVCVVIGLVALVGIGISIDGVPGLVCAGVGMAGLVFGLKEFVLRIDLPGRARRRREARRTPDESRQPLTQLRADLQQLGIPEITVTRQSLPARTVVVLESGGPGLVRASDLEHVLDQELLPALRRQAVTVIGPPGTFLFEPRRPDLAVEAWLPVAAGTSVAAPLGTRQLPEQLCLVAREPGSGIAVESAIARVEEFAREEGLTLAVPTGGDAASVPFVRFVGGPAALFTPEAAPSLEAEFTELCWPVRGTGRSNDGPKGLAG